VLEGQLDGKLTERGILMVQKLAERLKEVHFDAVYSSDLGRCKETTEILMQFHEGQTVTYDPLLREKSMGEFEGQRLTRTIEEARKRNVPFRYFKGVTGESWVNVSERAEQFLLKLVRTHSSEDCEIGRDLKVLVVSHAGWLMEMRNALSRWGNQPIYYSIAARNTTLYIIYFGLRKAECTGVYFLLTNDTSHLEGLKPISS
jgi:probable phosphoglycerate mutase